MAGLRVTTSAGGEAVLEDGAVEAFKARLRGALLRPSDDGYDDARAIWNGMIDKRPALIVRCTGAADVVDAVNFARSHGLLLAVRGGGHNVAGNAVCDGGLMIDLSLLRGVRVDPGERKAWAQGGATWGDLDRETQAFGLAAPGGVVSTTGIAGLTLGGGFGWLRRKHGLSIDNLQSVDIVTADGHFRKASEKENADLFWAVRGGGGNFGVVTSFEFRLHPVGPEVMLAAAMYPVAQAPAFAPRWREFMAKAPDEVSSQMAFWNVPDIEAFPAHARGKPVVIFAAVYAGPVEKGQRVLQPLREFGTPLVDLSGPAPFTGVQRSFDPFFPKGSLQYYWKSIYLNGLSDEVIAAIAAAAAQRPSPKTLINVWSMGGAMSRVRAEDTAFGDRSAAFLLEISSTWEGAKDAERNIAWTRDFWAGMKRFSSGGLYLNFPGLGEEREDLVRAAYGANYERLVALKGKYDPQNLFRLNQNIKPKT